MIQNGPLHKILTFRGALDFFGPSKSLDFVPGPFRILELAPFSYLAG
jgi:hypothetical protein